jgi:hypothetical protein
MTSSTVAPPVMSILVQTVPNQSGTNRELENIGQFNRRPDIVTILAVLWHVRMEIIIKTSYLRLQNDILEHTKKCTGLRVPVPDEKLAFEGYHFFFLG